MRTPDCPRRRRAPGAAGLRTGGIVNRSRGLPRAAHVRSVIRASKASGYRSPSSELEALPEAPNLVVPEAEAKNISDMVVDYHANLPFNFLDPEVPELFREAGRVNGLNKVRGERRTRQLVLPADGKMPFTPFARQRSRPAASNSSKIRANPPPSSCRRTGTAPGVGALRRVAAGRRRSPTRRPGIRSRSTRRRTFFLLQEEYHNGPRIIPYTDKHRPTNFRIGSRRCDRALGRRDAGDRDDQPAHQRTPRASSRRCSSRRARR